MSHIATIAVEIKDLAALKTAAHTLGLEFMEHQKTYRWYGRAVGRSADATDGLCDHALRVKGNANAYEIGVRQKADGSGYELKWDNFNGGYGLTAMVGEKAEKLRQQYAAEVAVKTARKAGFRVVSRTVKNGNIQIVTQR